MISFHLVGVDTEGILANALSADNYGNRIRKAESLFFEQLGVPPQDSGLWPLQHEVLWRGTRRRYELLFRNVRELPLESLQAQEGLWRVVIDFPFDRDGHTPMDDLAQLQKFRETDASSNCLVWLPAFFTHRTMDDLGRLVVLDHVLSGHNLNQCGSHLSQLEREQARVLLQNQRDQMRQRLRNAMLVAYGVSTLYTEAIDTSHELGGYVHSLNPALALQPPVGASFAEALQHLLAQALAHQFPAHPRFDEEAERYQPDLERLYQGLRSRLEAFGLEAHTAPRMQTAQAALALVHRICEADKDIVVQVIASAVLSTSAAAMREVVKTAQEQAAMLEDTLWDLFERLHQLSAKRIPHALPLVESVKDVLTRDEHVTPLVRGVKAAQSAALDVLTDEAEPPAPPPSRRHGGVRPLPGEAPQEADSEHGLDLQAAKTIFEHLARTLEANPSLRLDIDWRLYTKDTHAS